MTTYETRIKVRFSDVDPAGIAYYPKVIGFLHIAFEDFWEHHMGVPYSRVIKGENLGFPAVKLETEFLRPLRFGEEIRIVVGTTRVGRASTVFHYRLLGPEGDARADAKVTVVCVQLDTLQPRALPEGYRTAFLECLEPAE